MHSFVLFLVVLSYHVSSIYASTGPSAPVYVPTPSGRGTIDLITSCLFTLWPCIWTALHLNVPSSTRSWSRCFLRKLEWAICATIIPEYVLSIALSQLRAAREISSFKNRIVAEKAEQTHHPTCPTISSDQIKEDWTVEHGFFAIMGGFALRSEGTNGIAMAVEKDGIEKLAKLGLLPNISREAIRKKSRSSRLAKGIVCWQMSWMLVQVIARKASGLPVTLLELNTIAHVGCAIVLYVIWWYKPQDVSEQVIIDTTECTTCDRLLTTRGVFKSCLAIEVPLDPSELLEELFLGGVNMVYGGIHAAAWNAHFPTVVEQNFWRASSCTVMFGSLLVMTFMYWDVIEKRFVSDFIPETLASLNFLVIGLCFIARMFLIVEAFISIRALPVGAYDTVQWSNAFPHIG